MKPSSLPGLSTRARALLAAERQILAPPPELRWRAQLRARNAVGRGRNSRALAPRLVSAWRRTRVLLVAALAATSAVAAWQLAPQPVDAPPAIAIGTPRPPTAPALPTTSAMRTTPAIAKPTVGAALAPLPDATEPNLEPAVPQASSAKRSRADSTRKQPTPSEELTLLDKARRAVMARNFDRALRVIERHVRSFPNSPLAEEREALRVRALQGAGRSTQANNAAREFESRYPSSVLAPELNKRD